MDILASKGTKLQRAMIPSRESRHHQEACVESAHEQRSEPAIGRGLLPGKRGKSRLLTMLQQLDMHMEKIK